VLLLMYCALTVGAVHAIASINIQVRVRRCTAVIWRGSGGFRMIKPHKDGE
jgi:hypothetical protein